MPSDAAVTATAVAVALNARTAPPETSSNREPSLWGARDNLVMTHERNSPSNLKIQSHLMSFDLGNDMQCTQ